MTMMIHLNSKVHGIECNLNYPTSPPLFFLYFRTSRLASSCTEELLRWSVSTKDTFVLISCILFSPLLRLQTHLFLLQGFHRCPVCVCSCALSALSRRPACHLNVWLFPQVQSSPRTLYLSLSHPPPDYIIIVTHPQLLLLLLIYSNEAS